MGPLDESLVKNVQHWKRTYGTRKEKIQEFLDSDEFEAFLRAFVNFVIELLPNQNATANVHKELEACARVLVDMLSLAANCCHLHAGCLREILTKLKKEGHGTNPDRIFGRILKLGCISEFNKAPAMQPVYYRLLANLAVDQDSAKLLAAEPNVAVFRELLCWTAMVLDNENMNQKVGDHICRFLRSLMTHGDAYAHEISRARLIHSIAALVNPNVNEDLRGRCLQLLLAFSQQIRVDLFAEQIIYAQTCAPNLVNIASDDAIDGNTRKLAFDTIVALSESSPLRIELTKAAVLDLFQKIIRQHLAGDRVIFSQSLDSILGCLTKYCREAYSRMKLRECGLLGEILICVERAEPLSRIPAIVLPAFLDFQYDDSGLKYLIRHPAFCKSMKMQLVAFTAKNSCGIHNRVNLSEFNAKNFDEVEDDFIDKEDPQKLQNRRPSDDYRADSPAYVEQPSTDFAQTSSYRGPLYKDYTALWAAETFPIASPGCSPNGSPGPSWSPTHSSSGCSNDSSSNPFDRMPERYKKSAALTASSQSPATSRSSRASSTSPEPLNKIARYSSSNTGTVNTSRSSLDVGDSEDIEIPMEKCACTNLSPGMANSFHVIDAVVKLFAWFSHGDSTNQRALCNADLLESLLDYIAKVCRPLPKAGRTLKRLLLNIELVEEILSANLHWKIYLTLLKPLCKNDEEKCSRCIWNINMGNQLMKSLCVLVDSEYGQGIISHRLMVTNSEKTKLNAAIATCILIRSKQRRQMLLLGRYGLNVLLTAMQRFDEMAVYIVAAMRFLLLYGDSSMAPPSMTGMRESSGWNNVRHSDTNCYYETPDSSHSETIDLCVLDSNFSMKVSKETIFDSCPVFAAMFSGNFLEGGDGQVKHTIDDMDAKSMQFFVHFLYGCRNCPLMAKNLSAPEFIELFGIADRYMVQLMRGYLFDRLNEVLTDASIAIALLELSLIYQASDVAQRCLEFVMINSNKLSDEDVGNVFKSLYEKRPADEVFHLLKQFFTNCLIVSK